MFKRDVTKNDATKRLTQCCLPAFHRIRDQSLCQDVVFTNGNMSMVLDGCSAAVNSRFGALRFVETYKRLVLPKGNNTYANFDKNLKLVFDSLIKDARTIFKDPEELDSYIGETFLFTIVVCFKEDGQYKIKLFGDGRVYGLRYDGYITIINPQFPYNMPPFYGYAYMRDYAIAADYYRQSALSPDFDIPRFDTVIIATDGMDALTRCFGDKTLKTVLKTKDLSTLVTLYNNNREFFHDDVSAVIVE